MATEFERVMAHGAKEFIHGTVSVIVPVKDAEEYVSKMIRFIRSNWKDTWGALEIVIADDCSKDKTVEIAYLEADLVVTSKKRSGTGQVLRKAMDKARGDSRLVIHPTRLKEIDRAPIYLEWLKSGFDVVIGNRFASSRQNGYKGNLIARIARKIADQSIAPGINDLRAGFAGFSRRAGKALFETSYHKGEGIDAEIISTALNTGFKIREVPLTESDSPPVVEIIDFKHAVGMILDSYKTKSSLKKKNLVALNMGIRSGEKF
jgi:glycosyltransferase involved in cell wall biosynthesis